MDEDMHEMEPRSQLHHRTSTFRNSAARQVAVNFMPSRQLSHNTIRLRRNNSEHNALLEELEGTVDEEKQANIIVREMEQHQQLMEDNPEGEQLRREALRDLPQGLTMKRQVRLKLSASVSLRSKPRPITLWKRMKYRAGFAWQRASERLRNFVFSIELWYEAIRKIEGNFGSAVGSYFYFLRWLFMFDLTILVVSLGFLVVPQLLHDEEAVARSGDGESGFWNFVSGKGWLEDSLLFYGHYHSGDIQTRGPLTYNMSFAYFFTMASLYVVFFVVLCRRTAYSYRRNFIETSGGVRNVFANKVFSGWDFGIATQRAADLNARSIYNELKELLAELNKKNVTASFCTKWSRYLCNLVVTAFVLGCIGGLQYGFWLLLDMESATSRHWEVVVSAIITGIVCVVPLFFAAIIKLEYYTPRTQLYVTLARTFLLDMGTLFLLLFFWTRSNTSCWETSFGQETYRLVLLDACFSLILLPAFEFIRGFVYKCCPNSSPPQFNIGFNSLTLIYNQAVLWFGMLFSPLLVVAVTLKFLLLFYIKREVVMRACVPATKVWRAAQTQTLMYVLVTTSLFVTVFGIGSLFLGMSSEQCGPFRGYEHVYSVLTEGVLGLSRRRTLDAVLSFVLRPGVIAFVLLFLCVAVYYMKARSAAHKSMVGILRQMLVLEAKDKDFLLSAIAKVSNGEWMYSPESPTPNSHTWKYLHDDNVRKPSNAGFHLDGSRLSHAALDQSRPRSLVDNRPNSYHKQGSKSFDKEDGDTDSSFSWQGSSSYLNASKNDASERKWL